ncbi:hypothetical protein, partial [Paenibacillus sp. DS2015]|uniref:hypothetical protein n=1 Tax=Paenibacillus sp. DS2015 TaxID=3373917 RepID=UPI003D1FBCF5
MTSTRGCPVSEVHPNEDATNHWRCSSLAWGNVIKLISKTRAKIKMESETAWGKVLCRLFFV